MTLEIDLPRALRCAEYREELSRELDGFSLTDAALAAADELEARAFVKVKPLRWTSKSYAETPFGKYLVVREDWSDGQDFWFVCFAGKPYAKCGEHGSEEAAKAAAQADYERRIREALE